MSIRPVMLAALAAVALASAAAAGPEAARQRVAIDAKIIPGETFVLTPLKAGVVKRDSGIVEGRGNAPGRTFIRNGQRVSTHTNTWALIGKRGTLTLREQIEWVDIGNDANGDGENDLVGMATWKVVGGDGRYAGLTGGGGGGHVGLGNVWYARFEGFLTKP
jgi:hypothetical protein